MTTDAQLKYFNDCCTKYDELKKLELNLCPDCRAELDRETRGDGITLLKCSKKCGFSWECGDMATKKQNDHGAGDEMKRGKKHKS